MLKPCSEAKVITIYVWLKVQEDKVAAARVGRSSAWLKIQIKMHEHVAYWNVQRRRTWSSAAERLRGARAALQ